MSIKCIPGPTTRSYCLKCKEIGKMVGYIKPMVDMKCSCGTNWRTLASMCECCKMPSGTPDYVDCVHCKGKKKGEGRVNRGATVDNLYNRYGSK